MPVDDILTILVNMAHTLNPNSQGLFEAANQEFGQRLRNEYHSPDAALYIKPEDIVSVLTVLSEHGQLSSALKHDLIDIVHSNRAEYSYEVIAELAIVFATKIDEKHCKHFFDRFIDKFMQDLNYLKEDTLYKLVWAMIKAGRLVEPGDAFYWYKVQEVINKRAKDLSPGVLTNVLILSTLMKEHQTNNQMIDGKDFWNTIEPELILKMKQMELSDLINLMWSSLEIKRGSKTFYDELEKVMTRRIHKVKDEDFQTLLTCFANDYGETSSNQLFSGKFLDMVLKVIKDKKERFQLRTLVNIIWTLAKVDF